MYAGQYFTATASLLLAKKLPHPSFPAAALVQRHATILRASPREPCALRRSMCTNSSLVQFLIWKAHPSIDRESWRNCRCHLMFSCSYYLLQIILLVAQTEVDVRLEAAELDRSSIVRPARSKLDRFNAIIDHKTANRHDFKQAKVPYLAAACAVSKPPG